MGLLREATNHTLFIIFSSLLKNYIQKYMHLFTSSNNLLRWLQTATCFSANDVQACEFFNPMKKHGWAPKLSFRFYNIPLNNASKIYTVLHERKHQQDENETDQYWRCSL